ncbi:MAG TPA: guanitoxin biosynthesis heme-dependent pre-guanitoxin N-hydroxylase GntA [Rubricoccaceae bacterium]|jgi:hypothetical protein
MDVPCPHAALAALRAFALAPDYPCVMAASTLRMDQMTVRTYAGLGAGAAADLTRDLSAFAAEPDPERGFRSFAAVFGGDTPADEDAFEAQLWETLGAVHAADHMAWDPAVSADPADAAFSFSVGGRAFYVIGMHPNASRPGRRFRWPALLFNAHDQFESLRREGRYDRVRGLIRDRDRALAGSINPMMEDFGTRSEARQYAGRAVPADWQCPFHADRPD